ncbi:MAG: SurA N-terminal domain-containing protein [Rhodospirillales bacterium]|nr:SurA N-terminal domain-containing protein [Rhodospirillales bacterium]
MITKLRQAQDSWIAKLIFALTALSFMSLFGISGYLNRAAANPAVIRVNDNKISLAEFNMQLEEQIRMARKLFGDNIEITDEMRNAMANELVQKDLSELIVKEVATKKHIYVGNDLIRNIIMSQPQFREEDGSFNPARFKNFLSASNYTEQRYVESIRNDLMKSFLINTPVSGIKPSKTLVDLTAKAESQRKVFKYIEVDADKVKIDRKITDEEIEQYYNDFATELVEPEIRDITVLELTFDDIAKQAEISEEDINEFYNNNIERFEKPETREVLQMLFADQESADKAIKALSSGGEFYATAKELADQSKEDTELGYVSKDMLIAEIADDVFAARKNDVVGPVESELGWHIMKVKDIKPGSKMDPKLARTQIIDAIGTEKAYENAYEITKEIDDKIGSGSSLEDVAKELGVALKTVKGLTDTAQSPYTEVAFSYNQGEISQAEETDNGFVFVRVDNVVDSHPQDIAAATPKIKQLWEENERSAIAQEIINDVTNDLEGGDKIDEVAGRYHLKLNTTDALTRSQTFAGLKQAQMVELFNDNSNGKQFTVGGKTIIAVADRSVAPREMTEQDMDIINRRLNLDISQQAASQLINSYGDKYDVRVKYRQLGLED